jgi:flavorubredoxin
MIAQRLTDDIHLFRAIDWDRKLFDELVPLPEGTTYNAYLVRGRDKTALIDTVYPPKVEELITALKAAGVERLDYIVANHAEQDHTGAIPALLALHPEAKVVTNAKCKRFILDTLPVDRDAFITVRDGGSLDLGGKTLTFHLTPWVHWPDTMVTFAVEDRIAFTCDFLGAHLATTELYARDEAQVAISAKRYYAEIMMPYRGFSADALAKVEALDPVLVAPSHGPVHDRPAFIFDLYRGWTSDEVKPLVVIPYVSMYESTAKMVAYLTDRLAERGVAAQPVSVVDLDSGALAMSIVDASAIVFASPTVLGGPHPSLAAAAILINALAPKTRQVAVIGSFGWEGSLPEQVIGLLPRLEAEVLEPVMAKGLAREETLAEIARLADQLAGLKTAEAAAA